MTTPSLPLPDDYAETLALFKGVVRSAHIRAHRAVNTELLGAYWQIGRILLERDANALWGGPGHQTTLR